MKKWMALCLWFVLGCQDGPSSVYDMNSGQGIIGGQEVMPDQELSRTVFLIRKLSDPIEKLENNSRTISYKSSFCTASALTPHILLTAAHCVSHEAVAHNVEIKNESGETNYIYAEKIEIHPRYESESIDLALILLQEPMPSNTIFVSLPQRDMRRNTKKIIASGFGRTSGIPEMKESHRALRTADLPIADIDEKTQRILVSQSEGSGICSGDSGGPGILMEEGAPVVYGVAEKARYLKSDPLGDQCNFLGIYINVFIQKDWIEETIVSLEQSP